MRISDCSSDVCSSDLARFTVAGRRIDRVVDRAHDPFVERVATRFAIDRDRGDGAAALAQDGGFCGFGHARACMALTTRRLRVTAAGWGQARGLRIRW